MTVSLDQVAAAVARGRREILADIASGRVPASVATFSALHDHVDANEYGGLCDESGPFAAMDEAAQKAAAQVQDRLHEWLLAGRPEAAPPVITVSRAPLSAERRNVHVDGEYVGMVVRSSRRWAHGWAVHTRDARDLGDEPRMTDAVDALVRFVSSPFRRGAR